MREQVSLSGIHSHCVRIGQQVPGTIGRGYPMNFVHAREIFF
jgi:hypothetical protein